MSTDTIMITTAELDGATAVVEDGEVILGGSEYAYEGHGDIRQLAEVDAATQVVERYCSIGDDGSLTPTLQHDLQDLAEFHARWTGRKPSDSYYLVTKALVDRRIGKKDWLGSVSLDLNPAQTGRPQDLGHPTAPAVLVYEVKPGTVIAEQLTAPHQEPPVAMAVWFQPAIDDTDYPPRMGRNGRWYSNDTYRPGYMGVVATFATLEDADEALTALRRAVKRLATPVESDEPDAMREELVAADWHADREARLQRALRLGRELPAL